MTIQQHNNKSDNQVDKPGYPIKLAEYVNLLPMGTLKKRKPTKK